MEKRVPDILFLPLKKKKMREFYLGLAENEKLGVNVCPVPLSDSFDSSDLFINVCYTLSDLGVTIFHVEGFGRVWPVGADAELAIVLEQLEGVLRGLLEHGCAELNFYEQGIQSVVKFSLCGSHIKMSCRSLTDWRPDPSEIEMETRNFLALLERLIFVFNGIVDRWIRMSDRNQCIFKKWMHSVNVLFRALFELP